MARARLGPISVELLILDLVGLGFWPGGKRAEASAILTAAEAQVVVEPCAEGEERAVRDVPLVNHRNGVATHPHAVVEAGGAVVVGVVVDGIRTIFQRKSAGFAVGFVIRRGIQIPAHGATGIESECAPPGIQKKVAVRLAEAVCLLVIIVTVVTELPERAAEGGEIRIHVEAAENVCGLDSERRVERWFFHDKIDGAGWLWTIHERGTATDHLDAFNGIKRRRVVGLGVSHHVGVNWNAILEDLEKLSPVRIVTAIPYAQQRRVFLGEHETRRLRNNLPVVVHADVWNLLQIDIRGLFPCVDFCAIDIR